ncbi:hypothetical protein ACO0LC_24195 [Undibacterium sp. JH2W]|uniref:hypothetical protein n=1 Tax=Undibacterium sp. JH2W TaxID=3413037 RepID=UPI003BF000B9
MIKKLFFACFILFALMDRAFSDQRQRPSDPWYYSMYVYPDGDVYAQTNRWHARFKAKDGIWTEFVPIKLTIDGYFISKGNKLFFTNRHGGDVITSIDRGTHWENLGRAAETTKKYYEIKKIDGSLLGCGQDTLDISDDVGRHWRQSVALKTFNGEADSCISFSGNREVLFVRGKSTLYKSLDFGLSWEIISSNTAGLVNDKQNSFSDIENSHHNCELKGMLMDSLYMQCLRKIFVSLDQGKSWEEEGFGLPPDAKLDIRKISDNYLYLLVNYESDLADNYRRDLFIALDRKTLNKINDIEILPDDFQVGELLPSGFRAFYLLTEIGIYRSADLGATWTMLPAARFVTMLSPATRILKSSGSTTSISRLPH